MKRGPLPALFALVVVFALSFFWPGPYRYDELGGVAGGSYLVRVNRFTGQTEIFTAATGWKDRHPGATPDAALYVFAGAAALLLAAGAGWALGRRRPS